MIYALYSIYFERDFVSKDMEMLKKIYKCEVSYLGNLRFLIFKKKPLIFDVKNTLEGCEEPAVYGPDGYREWRLGAYPHRIGKPAALNDNGDEEWWVNGKLHRLDGPAVTRTFHKEWWINGKRHRLDGSAIENFFENLFYINDVKYEEEIYHKIIEKMNKSKNKIINKYVKKWYNKVYNKDLKTLNN